MRDDELVAAIVAGDPDGFTAAYDRYAAPLYSYCRMLFRDPEDAADAVLNTFVVAASRLYGLRDPARLRPWLFAVARNEHLRRHHVRRRAAEQTGRTGATQTEQAALVRDALTGAGPADRDVLTLSLHNLDADEQALVLGMSEPRLAAIASRATAQLTACLAVLLVARTGRKDCQKLDAMLKGWDGELTPGLRRRLAGHLERCATCTVRGHREAPPSVDEAALAAVPPARLRTQVLDLVTSADPVAASRRAAAVKLAGPFGDSGFPPRRAPQWRRRRVVHVSAAGAVVGTAAAAVLLLAGGGMHAVMPFGPSAAIAVAASGNVRPGPSPDPTGPGGGTGPASTGADGPLASKPAPSASPTPVPAPTPVQATTAATQGTVSLSATTLTLTPTGSTALTITAHGGPVQWSLKGQANVVDAVRVSQDEGTLAAGQSVTVMLTEVATVTTGSELAVFPGGELVKLIAG